MTKPKNIAVQEKLIKHHSQPAKYFVYRKKKYWKTDEGWFLKSDIIDMGKFGDDDFYSVRVGC